MPFDGLMLKSLLSEITPTIIESRIERIYQHTDFEINLFLYKNGATNKLIISANPSLPKIFLSQINKKNPDVAPNFCMLLRKNLIGGKIINVEQYDFERIVKISIQTRNELGDSVERNIIFEMMGKHSNIILTNQENRIIDAIKRLPPDITVRTIMPGRIYELPTVIKKSITEISFEDYKNLFFTQNIPLEKFLLNNFSGFSKQLSNEISLYAQEYLKNLSDEQFLKRSFDYIKELINIIENKNFNPILYFDNQNKPIDFYFINLRNIYKDNYKQRTFDSINKCIEQFYTIKEEQFYFNEKKTHLKKVINQAFEKIMNKYEINMHKISEANQADELKKYGDLIYANLNNLEIDNQYVKVIDYYSDDLKQIYIPIDKSKSIVDNANNFYKQFNKLKKGMDFAVQENQKLEQDINFLGNLDAMIDTATSLDDLDLISMELEKEGYLKQKHSSVKFIQSKKHTFHHFISFDGFDIYVGRNNQQNDYLTLKFASNDDIWLHTQKIPGSHVIIKTNNKEVPFSTIIQAAEIAAFFSKARMSTKVPVDYTFIKYIKKPPHSKAGYVIYENFKTIIVDPPNDVSKFNKYE